MIATPQAEKAALEKAERGIATRLRKNRRAGTGASANRSRKAARQTLLAILAYA
jgi:hypothetical protein